ncbi:hypothetical protein C2G38_2177342 [Gigaspora rosea]|uniref:F-box domain-containing protein n=1 Tax=Gigaspora rosea TaxID=44941 RepID=A0A397VFD6_9GLOM|nr:hypothetical protein C2G38_2177342 [Gigaspora rosea]
MAKILKCPGCDRVIKTGKTRDLNKHMNLNGNLRKGQCQLALLIMQNVGNVTPEQNTPQTENITPEQNLPATPEDDLISFDKNPPTLQPREASALAVDPWIRESEMSQRLEAQHPRYSASSSSKQNSMSYQDKTILIHKNIANGFEFYDGKRKWYGVKEDFCALHNKYHFIKANNGETIMEAYKRINDESEAIAKKTNGRIDMHKSENYTLTTIKFFKEPTLAPQKSEKISEQESAWIDLATTGALIFAERYEGEANQYDVNSMYIFEIIKKDASWPIAPATIEGNSPKKSLQCTRYLRYNPYGIYTHYDLECAKENGLKKEGGIVGKVSKALLFSLWGALCEQRNGQNYGAHPRIKPFLLASARKTISEIVKPLGDQVKRIHTDGFIVAGKVELKTGIEIGDLKFEKRGICIVKNCISVTWKPPYPEIPNLLTNNIESDFKQIQKDKKQNSKLMQIITKKIDINLPNEIIMKIFQHLRIQNNRLDTECPISQCANNELLFPVLYVNKRWNECATYLIWRRITLYRYNIRNFVNLIKKKLLPNPINYIRQIEFERIDNYYNMNEFLLEDIIKICQDIIILLFKDCGWGLLNNNSLKITLDICKNLRHIFIYGSNRIAPKTILSIPQKCANIKTIKIQNCERITNEIINQIASKYPKIMINEKNIPTNSFIDRKTI